MNIPKQFKEPSTYAALAVLLVAFGLNPEFLKELEGMLALIAGGLGVALKERV